MKFTKTSEKLPELGEEVLIRYKEFDDIGYYVCVLCYKYSNDDTLIFKEACGERYRYWNVEDVKGWMYVSELNNIE